MLHPVLLTHPNGIVSSPSIVFSLKASAWKFLFGTWSLWLRISGLGKLDRKAYVVCVRGRHTPWNATCNGVCWFMLEYMHMHRLCVCADFLPALGICACKHASSFCLVPQWEVYPELVWLVWSFRIIVAGMTQRPSCAWGKCSIRFGSTSMSKVLISLYLVILFAIECVRPVWLPTSSPFIFTCLFIFMSTAAAGTLPLSARGCFHNFSYLAASAASPPTGKYEHGWSVLRWSWGSAGASPIFEQEENHIGWQGLSC